MTATDILAYALRTIMDGPLPDRWQDHGPFCPWCAISYAKGAIDERDSTGLSTSDALYHWNNLTVSDLPLVEARDALPDRTNTVLSQVEAVTILTDALTATSR